MRSTPRATDFDTTTPWLRTAEPTTLLSVNDGQAHIKYRPDTSNLMARDPMTFERTNFTRDSITLITLGSDHAPVVRTVYGTVPNTVMGPAYLATSSDGRYAYVTCHTQGNIAPENGDVLSVIDLASPALEVVQRLPILASMQAVAHPNGGCIGHLIRCQSGKFP
ncbi:MAG: YncE family protein [Verrucomicrobiia bacterium]